MLKSIYRDLRTGLSVTTEVVSGYVAILLGNLAVPKAVDNLESLPMVIYMAFNSESKIRKMTIAVVDLQLLTDAIRNAAQTGAVNNT